jgi:hypothetical protein
LAAAPSASAQDATCAPGTTPPCSFEHDTTRDGTANEVTSGFYGGDDGDNSNGDPLEDRYPNTYETFEFVIPEGTQAGSFTVNVTWEDARVDLDLYVYRIRPDGAIAPNNVTSSAAFGDNTEDATYTPRNIGSPVEPDRYLIVVDNWCSRDADDDPTTEPADTSNCGIGEEIPDEDYFFGSVTLGALESPNRLPSVALNGPDAGRTGQPLTYTAQGEDPGGRIVNYKFDLNGDGFFETNTLTGNVATAEFDVAGVYNVGVQATDDSGDTAYASKAVRVTGPPATTSAALDPLKKFSLGRPVFGGAKRKNLKITYRLRERSNVRLTLHRGSKRIRVLSRGTRGAGKHKLLLKPRGLRRGRYSVRIVVRSASGQRQVARLYSKRL